MSIRTYFENIASAIKQKNPNIVTVTPSQMPQAILDIPSGGGGFSPIEPLHTNFTRGYVEGDYFRLYNGTAYQYENDEYEIQAGHFYLLTQGGTVGDRFKPILTTIDTYTTEYDRYGYTMSSSYALDQTAFRIKVSSSSSYKYLTITKSQSGQTNINTYLFDITDWS